MEPLTPYRPRPIRPLPPLEHEGWRLKVYGISVETPAPRDELVEAGRRIAVEVIPQPAVGDGRYGVGFVGIHDGHGACFVFVDWWADENELHHHVFIALGDRPSELVDHTATGPAACVWDLAVIGYERQAWIDTVMANPDGPYLACHLDAVV